MRVRGRSAVGRQLSVFLALSHAVSASGVEDFGMAEEEACLGVLVRGGAVSVDHSLRKRPVVRFVF